MCKIWAANDVIENVMLFSTKKYFSNDVTYDDLINLKAKFLKN